MEAKQSLFTVISVGVLALGTQGALAGAGRKEREVKLSPMKVILSSVITLSKRISSRIMLLLSFTAALIRGLDPFLLSTTSESVVGHPIQLVHLQ